MGVDPISIGLAAAAIGGGIYSATRKPPKAAKPLPPPPTPVTGETGKQGRKVRKYRPPAQLFKNEDLRLGSAGKLGM